MFLQKVVRQKERKKERKKLTTVPVKKQFIISDSLATEQFQRT